MITSKENQLVKYVKSLYQKKYRDLNKEYIVEGIKMVKEAIENQEKISKIFLCEELLKNILENDESICSLLYQKEIINLTENVSKSVFEYISDTMSPQGILAILKEKNNKTENYSNIIFALDNLQDPGNLGTIIRTLDSAGYKDLLLSKDTADPYSPKVVRSTMGGIFRLNIHRNIDLENILIELKSRGYKLVSTSLDADSYYYNLKFDERLVIIIGNESKGVSEAVQNLADILIKIPMIGKTESLNAAVATSIIAYEGVRQKLSTQSKL